MQFTARHDDNGLTCALLAKLLEPGAAAVRDAAAAALGAMLPVCGNGPLSVHSHLCQATPSASLAHMP